MSLPGPYFPQAFQTLDGGLHGMKKQNPISKERWGFVLSEPRAREIKSKENRPIINFPTRSTLPH